MPYAVEIEELTLKEILIRMVTLGQCPYLKYMNTVAEEMERDHEPIFH